MSFSPKNFSGFVVTEQLHSWDGELRRDDVFGSLQIGNQLSQAIRVVTDITKGLVAWFAQPTSKNTSLVTVVECSETYVAANLAGIWARSASHLFSTLSCVFPHVVGMQLSPLLSIARPWRLLMESRCCIGKLKQHQPCSFAEELGQERQWLLHSRCRSAFVSHNQQRVDLTLTEDIWNGMTPRWAIDAIV